MSEEENNESATEQPPQRAFILAKTYIKDISFEVPGAPVIFTKLKETPLTPPEVKFNGNARGLGKDSYEYTLGLEVIAKSGKDIAYLAEVQQCGIFHIMGHSVDELKKEDFRDRCPRELFPFAREALSSLISKGGFGPELLGSVNFQALFNEQRIAVDQQAQKMVEKQLDSMPG